MQRRGYMCGLFLTLLWLSVGHAQTEMRQYTVTVTDSNQTVTITIPAKRLTVNNLTGTTNVWVNISGTGTAATTGETNGIVLAGTAEEILAGSGESITKVGIISDDPGPSTVYLKATR